MTTDAVKASEQGLSRAACEAQIASWQEVGEQKRGMLIGQRLIVLDTRGRAYGALPDGRYKLEYPRANLVGVSHFDQATAHQMLRRLAAAVPAFAPYQTVDCQAYADSRVEQAQGLLSLVETMTSPEPLPEGPRMWVITAGNEGEFVVNSVTGEVESFTVYSNAEDPLDFEMRAEIITRFNVEEYRQWFESEGLDEPTNLNWLGIGFWDKNGRYESFEQDWRDDLVVALKQRDLLADADSPAP